MARPRKDINEALLLKKYFDGATSRELAKEFNISHSTVMDRVSKYIEVDVRFSIKRNVKLI